MDAHRKLECMVELHDGRTRLLSPEVGLYVQAPSVGTVLAAGQVLGRVVRLGVVLELIVPETVIGVVVSEPPTRLRQPVGYGDVLAELKPISAAGSGVTASTTSGAANDVLVVKAPSSGRFWHRPAPGEAAYAQAGQRLAEGAALGLLEVMKTFSHIGYKSGGVLPPNARFVRYACADGAEVKAGAALVVVEP
jgi:acetyl-CoA carboxylase biotin carboxyl carrier protein